jgi:restriction system protein
MTKVWCVRADGGRYTGACVAGGFTGIGWSQIGDLSSAKSRDDLYPIYREAYPSDTSNIVIGQQVGQLARFLFDIKAGDTVITPDADGEQLWHGVVDPDPSYFYQPNDPACRYGHRRRVSWSDKTLMRSGLSVPLQNTLQSSLTVFAVSQLDEVLQLTGRGDLAPVQLKSAYDPHSAVLARILTLDDKEFEILVGHLLTAVGFDGSEVVGKVGDGGVDAMGELNIAGLAKIKIYVQAKRYKVGTKIAASTVRQLRQAIPFGGQGAFITTADFQKAAFEVALETGFPRIGLVNGSQLVDLLVEHWTDIPAEFQERLGLKPGLVLA